MGLNLGLESLDVSTPMEDVSFESVLTAQIDMLNARSAFEHSVYDLATTMRNVHNFNEVVNSLQKHSSVECAAYAADLLGIPSVEAVQTAEVPADKQKNVDKTSKAWYIAVADWVKKSYKWITIQINKLIAKFRLKHIEKISNPKVKVHFSLADLEKIASGESKFWKITPTSIVLDLSDNDAAMKYLQAINAAEKTLFESSAMLRTPSERNGSVDLKARTQLAIVIQRLQKYLVADTNKILGASASAATAATKTALYPPKADKAQTKEAEPATKKEDEAK